MVAERKPGKRQKLKDLTPDEMPVMWPFRVDWVETLPPERLDEWERAMRDKAGMDPAGMRAAFKPGCVTKSGSGDGWDDSDYWGIGC